MSASGEEKQVKKFVAPGTAGRAPRMAPTAFQPSQAAQQAQQPTEPDGSERPSYNRFPGRFGNKDAHQQSRPPVDGDSEESKKRFVSRQNQPSRYHGNQQTQPTEESSGTQQSSPQHAQHSNHHHHHHHSHHHQHQHHQHQHHQHHQNPRRTYHHDRHGPQKEGTVEAKTFSRPPPGSPTVHKLGRAYTFSVYRRPAVHAQDGESYEKSIKTIGRFDSVEGFWAFYSHIHHPGDLTGMNADYHLFVEGIAPVWEHDINKSGGKFSIRLKKGLVNALWEDLLLAFIGEQFEDSDEICGVVVSVRHKDAERKRDALAVWIKDSSKVNARDRIEQQLRSTLHLSESADVEYKPHSTSLQDLHPARPPHSHDAEDGGGD